MVRLRLRRVGGKGQPSYRLVAADKESPRDGRFIEVLGFYNPRTEPATIQLKEDRIFDWLQKGAQPSDAAEKVMRSAGALERYERFKAGEDIETLLAEASAAEAERNIDPKTTRVGEPAKKKAKPVEESPVKAEPEPEPEATQAEAEPEAEEIADADEGPVAEVPEPESEPEAEQTADEEEDAEAEDSEQESESDEDAESEAEPDPEAEPESEEDADEAEEPEPESEEED